MKISIKGNLSDYISNYYLQTFSLLFFPEDNYFGVQDSSTNYIVFCIEKVDLFIEAFIDISYEKKINKTLRTYQFSNLKNIKKDLQLLAGEIFYECASKLTGYYPPWGIHTGIRPSLLAEQLVNEEKDDRDVIGKLVHLYKLSETKAALALEVYKNTVDLLEKEKNKISEKDFSLYISIPFCPSRCRYCSFISYAAPKHLKIIPEYLIKLYNEIDIYKNIASEKKLKLKTVYIGGGTPSVLDENQIKSLLDKINSSFNVSDVIEYTFEAGRADTITIEKLKSMYDGNVTRISINPQTTNDETLQKIGRKHTTEQFYRAYELIKNSGIKHINTDCIIGLEDEDSHKMIKTSNDLLRLSPDNITVHTLCVKRSSDIKSEIGEKSISPEKLKEEQGFLSDVMDKIYLRLKDSGYKPYYLYKQKYTAANLENTGYAKPDSECLYNIYMMDELQNIFGIGAGATTKIIKASDKKSKIERIINNKYPFEYIKNNFAVERELVKRDNIFDIL